MANPGDEARAALADARDWAVAHNGSIVAVRLTTEQIAALLDEAVPTMGKTIKDRMVFEAAVSNRAREIADAREVFTAAAAARESEPTADTEWEYGRTVPKTDRVEVWAERDRAEHWARMFGGSVMRRTRASSYGPWEPVEAAEGER